MLMNYRPGALASHRRYSDCLPVPSESLFCQVASTLIFLPAAISVVPSSKGTSKRGTLDLWCQVVSRSRWFPQDFKVGIGSSSEEKPIVRSLVRSQATCNIV